MNSYRQMMRPGSYFCSLNHSDFRLRRLLLAWLFSYLSSDELTGSSSPTFYLCKYKTSTHVLSKKNLFM